MVVLLAIFNTSVIDIGFLIAEYDNFSTDKHSITPSLVDLRNISIAELLFGVNTGVFPSRDLALCYNTQNGP